MRKRTRHDVLNILLTLLIKKEQVILILQTHYLHHAKIKTSQTHLALKFARHPALLLCAFQCVCQGSCLAVQIGFSEVPPYLGSSMDLLHAAQIVKSNFFVLCLFQRPQRLGLLVFSRFQTLDLLV